MSDSDKTLDILIKTRAELAGAKAAMDAMERQIGMLKAQGKETALLEAQLKKGRAAIEAFGKAHDEPKEKAKLFAGEMGEVKHAIRELSSEFPIAGLALRLMTNLIGGLVTAAITGFALAKQALDKWNESLDETAKKLAEPTFLEAIEARRAALEAGALSGEKFADKLAHLIDPEEAFQRTLAESIALLHTRAAAIQGVADATFGFDSAKLKQQLDAGLIEQAQYYIQLGELEKKHEAEKLAREKAAHQEELAILQDGLNRATKRQPELLTQSRQTRQAATSAQSKADTDASLLKILEGLKEGETKAVADAYEKVRVAEGGLSGLRQRAAYVGYDPYANQEAQKSREVLDEYDKATTAQRVHLDKAEEIRRRLPDEKVNAALAGSAAERAEGYAESNQNRIREQGDEIADKTKAFGFQDAAATAANREKANQIDTQTRAQLDKEDIGGGYTGADLEKAALYERLKSEHKKLTEGQDEWLAHFRQFLDKNNGQTAEGIGLMRRIAGTQNGQQDQLDALKREVAILEKRNKEVHNR